MSVNKRFKFDQSALESIDQQNISLNSDLTENNSVVVSNYFCVPENRNPQEQIQEQTEKSKIPSTPASNDVSFLFLTCVNNLNFKLNELNFSKPVEFIYNPTEYAYDVFKNYVDTYCKSYKSIMFLGMNPGPWGMSQTGVPFGEINAVRDWLKLHGSISKPSREAPSRPVLGFKCKRSEISGKRFWSLIQELCKTPENFFRNSFVHNYCPLQLMTASGKNVTPAEIKVTERETLFNICDASLLETVNIYKVNIILCIGRFVETRVKKILKTTNLSHDVKVLTIPHPSPRTVGNNNWQEETLKLINILNLLPYFKQPGEK